MLRILRNRSLMILVAAEVISALGSWITSMALYAIIVFEGTGGVTETSALFLAAMGPSLLLGPAAGWLADRFDRKWLMIASQSLSGLIVAGVLLVGTDRLAPILVLVLLHAIAGSVMGPARQAVIPALVDRADLTRANAFLQQLAGLVKVLAPMLAGFVLTLLEPRQAILLDVLSYGLAALALLWLPPLPTQQRRAGLEEGAPGEGGWAGLRRTLAGVNRQAPLLRWLAPVFYLLALLLLAFDVSVAVFTRDLLRASSDFMGLLVGLIGLGTSAAALFLMAAAAGRSPWRDLVTGMLMMAALPLAVALADVWGSPAAGQALLLAGSLVGGLGIGLANVQAQTLVQQLAPAGWLGRLSGLFQSVMVAGQLTGLLLTPLLVPGLLSFGLFFGLGTGVLLLAGVALQLRIGRGGERAASPPAPAD
ncbi:MAG: MFS transporter [Bacillota bacterium]